SAGVAKGMSEGLKHGVEHGCSQLELESIEAYDPEAEAKFVAALQSLKDLKFSLLDQLEGLKDAPMDVRGPRKPWACKEEIALADAIAANISRAEKKKKCRIVCQTHGVGSVYHARSDGIPVSVPSAVPQGLALLLVDGATQTDPEESLFAFYALWESLLLPNVLGLVLWTRSSRPLGLQPAYAADHAPRSDDIPVSVPAVVPQGLALLLVDVATQTDPEENILKKGVSPWLDLTIVLWAKCRIVCRTHGVGSAHHARSDGIPVSVPSVVPQGLALLLVDGVTQTGPEENLFAFYAPWESLLLPNVLGLVLWTRSPRPLGLQPAYAADHAPRYMVATRFFSPGVTDDVFTNAHSAGISRELRIVTIPSSVGNLSISWTVDGTA
nr:hypothetical protein [Tanacetum cinerariifolium]